MSRVFANGPGDLSSLPSRHTKDLKPPCLRLSFIRYVSKVKLSKLGKGVAPFPTLQCNSYRKGSLRVTLDCGCQQICL